jgi:hypothetical protein
VVTVSPPPPTTSHRPWVGSTTIPSDSNMDSETHPLRLNHGHRERRKKVVWSAGLTRRGSQSRPGATGCGTDFPFAKIHWRFLVASIWAVRRMDSQSDQSWIQIAACLKVGLNTADNLQNRCPGFPSSRSEPHRNGPSRTIPRSPAMAMERRLVQWVSASIILVVTLIGMPEIYLFS